MKQQISAKTKANDKRKIAIVYTLFFMAAAIMASGAFFSIYSLINQITFKVINTNVSGAIFGIVVAYLGLRYFMAVHKLKEQLYDTNAKFSWDNFRKKKLAKSR